MINDKSNYNTIELCEFYRKIQTIETAIKDLQSKKLNIVTKASSGSLSKFDFFVTKFLFGMGSGFSLRYGICSMNDELLVLYTSLRHEIKSSGIRFSSAFTENIPLLG